MVFERPKPKSKNAEQSASPAATQRTNASHPKKVTPEGGSGSSGKGGGGESSGNQGGQNFPSPWLEHPTDPVPQPNVSASFVEYLRWMRSPDSAYKDPTKVQLMQMAEAAADYRDRLSQLTQRTKLMAGDGNTFLVLRRFGN
jgi:CRISPR-associated protein Cmr6